MIAEARVCLWPAARNAPATPTAEGHAWPASMQRCIGVNVAPTALSKRPRRPQRAGEDAGHPQDHRAVGKHIVTISRELSDSDQMIASRRGGQIDGLYSSQNGRQTSVGDHPPT